MRGHGATMSATIRAAVYRAIYAMQNATAQMDAIAWRRKWSSIPARPRYESTAAT